MPEASFLISNEFRPVKNMTVTNRLQLFTNYINNPLNIDVDWEMIFQANLNWFTDVRLNTHLIFDDDTKTPVFDEVKILFWEMTDYRKKLPGFSSRSCWDYRLFSGFKCLLIYSESFYNLSCHSFAFRSHSLIFFENKMAVNKILIILFC